MDDLDNQESGPIVRSKRRRKRATLGGRLASKAQSGHAIVCDEDATSLPDQTDGHEKGFGKQSKRRRIASTATRQPDVTSATSKGVQKRSPMAATNPNLQVEGGQENKSRFIPKVPHGIERMDEHFDTHYWKTTLGAAIANAKVSGSSKDVSQAYTLALSLLGLDLDAIQSAIRQKYLLWCVKLHPDKGGCNDRFALLLQAYEAAMLYHKTQ